MIFRQASQKNRKGNDQNELRKVPNKFKGLEEYLEVFESLLLEECRAQIQRGNEEEGMLSYLFIYLFIELEHLLSNSRGELQFLSYFRAIIRV